MNQHLPISEIHKKRQRSRVTPEDILFDWLRRFGRALRSIFNIQRCVYGDPSSIVTEHRL